MSQYGFGAGVLWGIPTISNAGAVITVPTPVAFGALQDVSIDISWTMKELYGQFQMPLAVGRGTAKITGKAKAARMSAALFNLVFGELPAAGEIHSIFEEDAVVLTASSNNCTVAHNGNGVFLQDLGVTYAATGLPLTRTSNANAPGLYSVDATGVYSFDENNNTAVHISYTYAKPATGSHFSITNQLLGVCPFFKVILNEEYQGKTLHIELNRVISGKLTLATKLEDFMIPEFDLGIMADDSNIIGSISMLE